MKKIILSIPFLFIIIITGIFLVFLLEGKDPNKPPSALIKKDIIKHLWKIIISDNAIDQYESNLMRRICGLIYFPDKECAEIKLKLVNYK